eukprot:COSAG01_NODE_1133_length_11566_cov_25.815819_1_plen_156_part_00
MEDQKLSQGSHLEITAAVAAESSLLPGIHEIRPPGGIPLASCRQHARCNEGHLIYTPFGAEKGSSFFACFNINRIVESIHVLRPAVGLAAPAHPPPATTALPTPRARVPEPRLLPPRSHRCQSCPWLAHLSWRSRPVRPSLHEGVYQYPRARHRR